MTHWLTKHARHIALGLLLAMTVQAGAAAALSATTPSSQPGAFSIPIIICTPAGIIVLPMDFNLETDDPPAFLKHNIPDCIFCAAHHCLPGMLVLAVMFVFPPNLRPAYPRPQDDNSLPDAPRWLRMPVRAPPAGL